MRVLTLLLAGATWVSAADIRGRVTDPDGLPLPGVVVTLATDAAPTTQSAVTDAGGVYQLDAPPGRYRLVAELAGFQPQSQADVVVGVDRVDVNFSLALAVLRESVTVSADSDRPLLGDPAPNGTATITREVIDNAMLPNSRYDDVLPLMPGVVRGPDGQISIQGARPSEGALFVNGVDLTNPVTGRAGLIVPIESVDAVRVHAGGYPADLGPATGGVTSVRTRAGGDQWHLSFDSLLPRLLFEDGGLQGVEFWEPDIGLSGPIVTKRLFLEEGASYRYDRYRFDTLAGPVHNIVNAPLSWSQIDAQLSTTQHLRGSLAVNREHADHAGITAFTPPSATPAVDNNVWTASLADHVAMGRASTLDVTLAAIETRSSVVPVGTELSVVGHQLSQGSYFDRRTRQGNRLTASATETWTPSNHHVVQLGLTQGRASLSDIENSAPVSLLRSDGSVSRRITFDQGGPAHVDTLDGYVFLQDTWVARSWLTIEAGIRHDHSSALHAGVSSPRVAWTIGQAAGTTTLSGSLGTYADKVLLSALTFPSEPGRLVEALDPSGEPAGPAVHYENAAVGALEAPRATRWDLALDRRIAGRWQLHARYQERLGAREFVVRPLALTASRGLLSLASDGSSVARSLETTVGYGRGGGAGDEVYVSYVRASTRGHLNDLAAIDGIDKEPFVQSDQVGPLSSDVPHRLLAWGLVQVPGHWTLAPFIEVRTGFPYSPINDDWTFAGDRNGSRLPWFGSLNLSITRVVELPRQLPRARVGIKLYNLAAVHTERDVQRDVAAVDAGARFNAESRDFAFVAVFLLGRHPG